MIRRTAAAWLLATPLATAAAAADQRAARARRDPRPTDRRTAKVEGTVKGYDIRSSTRSPRRAGTADGDRARRVRQRLDLLSTSMRPATFPGESTAVHVGRPRRARLSAARSSATGDYTIAASFLIARRRPARPRAARPTRVVGRALAGEARGPGAEADAAGAARTDVRDATGGQLRCAVAAAAPADDAPAAFGVVARGRRRRHGRTCTQPDGAGLTIRFDGRPRRRLRAVRRRVFSAMPAAASGTARDDRRRALRDPGRRSPAAGAQLSASRQRPPAREEMSKSLGADAQPSMIARTSRAPTIRTVVRRRRRATSSPYLDEVQLIERAAPPPSIAIAVRPIAEVERSGRVAVRSGRTTNVSAPSPPTEPVESPLIRPAARPCRLLRRSRIVAAGDRRAAGRWPWPSASARSSPDTRHSSAVVAGVADQPVDLPRAASTRVVAGEGASAGAPRGSPADRRRTVGADEFERRSSTTTPMLRHSDERDGLR